MINRATVASAWRWAAASRRRVRKARFIRWSKACLRRVPYIRWRNDCRWTCRSAAKYTESCTRISRSARLCRRSWGVKSAPRPNKPDPDLLEQQGNANETNGFEFGRRGARELACRRIGFRAKRSRGFVDAFGLRQDHHAQRRQPVF